MARELEYPIAKAYILLALIIIAGLLSFIGQNVIYEISCLYPQIISSPNPYFIPEHAFLLYLWSPVVILCSILFLLSPGFLWVLALDHSSNFGEWFLRSFGVSLVWNSAITAFIQAVMLGPVDGKNFFFIILASIILIGIIFLIRTHQKKISHWPLLEKHNRATLVSMIIFPIFMLILLSPKFFWESFNGDGAHAYESARLLLIQPFPFFDQSAGEISSFPGLTSMLFAYPLSWFIRLFGNYEASVRLPFLLFIPVLFGIVNELINFKRQKSLKATDIGMVWVALCIYTVVMAYSATYSPYSADIALPGTQDTLFLICFLGFCHAYLKNENFWMFFFLTLTFLSLPSSIVMICFWLIGVIIFTKPVPWKKVIWVSTGLAGLEILQIFIPILFRTMGIPGPGQEYGLVGTLSRFAFLQWTDWKRLNFLVVPSGILPSTFILFYFCQDRISRIFSFLTLTYFLFMYFQAYISLHHFVPVMVLPLIVFWRMDWIHTPKYRKLLLPLVFISSLVALFLSLPENLTPYYDGRQVGETIFINIPGYDQSSNQVFNKSEGLQYLFPLDWDSQLPEKSFGGSRLVWNYYAKHKPEPKSNENYILQMNTDAPPQGFQHAIYIDKTIIYIRNVEVWKRHLSLRPPTPAGSPLYWIPRGVLFRSEVLPERYQIISMIDVVAHFGIDVNRILDQLGVAR